ncbi:MAG: class I SAM-dependent methyltransferase, partial [Akkermansiaceae bacterium]|nr:class I SAM-dependent methyltransferase [Akkermansiaceae bacterium]
MPAPTDPAVRDLYETRRYPAMSHPLSDPAVTAIAARLGGLDTAHPAQARILEIGCASGHNLLPLALRWPAADFTGIDLSPAAIATANELAAEADLPNVRFLATDLRDFDPGPEPFDFIIAHGFFSWVPDEVKRALLEFCPRHLAANGIATISLNLADGWAIRQPLVALARKLTAPGAAPEPALALIRRTLDPATPYGALMTWVIDDMLAKGPDILAFDDFGPVCDAWAFDRFVQTAGQLGLRWLGESDPAENLPSTLGPAARTALEPLARQPLLAQLIADFATARTFRSGVLCRADAPVPTGAAKPFSLDLAIRAGQSRPPVMEPLVERLYHVLDAAAPCCPHLDAILATLRLDHPGDLAEPLIEGITRGWILPRVESVVFSPDPPEMPALNPLALACARRKLPVVDIWHTPCAFPEHHYAIIAAMDGTRTTRDLATFAASTAPDL